MKCLLGALGTLDGKATMQKTELFCQWVENRKSVLLPLTLF